MLSKIFDASDRDFLTAVSCGAFRGAVKGLANSTYHSLGDYYSSSDLKSLYSSTPKHFHFNKYGINRIDIKQSEPMILGSLVHSLLLTPGEFSNEFYILPDLDFRTKEGRERKQQLFSDNPGKIAVPEDLMSKGKDIIASCSEDENIRNLLEDSVNEISFFWECPVTHLNFKAKIDGYVQGKYFIELKTTRTAEPSGFSSIINDRNYDLSLVHYMEGIKAFTGVDVPEVYFIAVETSAPFVTQVYRASDDMITLGREKWLNTIVRLKDAISRKKWDGYWYEENTIPTISPPGWAIKKSEALGGQDELWEAI